MRISNKDQTHGGILCYFPAIQFINLVQLYSLYNHTLWKSQVNSYFARCAGSLNRINMVEIPEIIIFIRCRDDCPRKIIVF